MNADVGWGSPVDVIVAVAELAAHNCAPFEVIPSPERVAPFAIANILWLELCAAPCADVAIAYRYDGGLSVQAISTVSSARLMAELLFRAEYWSWIKEFRELLAIMFLSAVAFTWQVKERESIPAFKFCNMTTSSTNFASEGRDGSALVRQDP
jgi:hypothetical protein